MKTVFFVDTNLFLQFQDIGSLDWSEISDGDPVVIMISRPVQEEIDRFKNDGNNRRARRARLANSLIGEAISSPGMSLTKATRHAKVQVAFPPDYTRKELEAVSDWLDLTKPDHELIATALCYKKTANEEQVFLLTNDTLPMLTARRCGLDYQQIPESWQLPPEPDEKDKRLREVERKIERLEQQRPKIHVVFRVDKPKTEPPSPVVIETLDRVNRQEVEELINIFTERYPLRTSYPKSENELPISGRLSKPIGPFGAFLSYQPPTDDEIERYKAVEYPFWVGNLRSWVEAVQRRLIELRRHVFVTFLISNTGVVPLTNAMIEFSVQGAAICPPKETEEPGRGRELPEIPAAPSPPLGTWRDSLSLLRSLEPRLASLTPPKYSLTSQGIPSFSNRHDIHAFYWRGGRPSEAQPRWEFECDEFRHGVEPEEFSLCLNVGAHFELTK